MKARLYRRALFMSEQAAEALLVFRRFRAGDQARAAIVSEVTEPPADEDNQAVLEIDQVHQVDEKPQQPRDDATEVQFPQVGNGGLSTDDRECAFVEIVERLDRLVF